MALKIKHQGEENQKLKIKNFGHEVEAGSGEISESPVEASAQSVFGLRAPLILFNFKRVYNNYTLDKRFYI